MGESVSLSVRGVTYEGWKSIRISRSIKAVAASFSLSVTDNWTGLERPWILKPGDECEVKTNGQTVVRGYIDTLESSYDARSRSLSVSGREITGDLVDSSARYSQKTEFRGISVFSLAQKLCDPFGVKVRNDSGNTKAIELVAIGVGETVHQVLDKAARQVGLLLSSDGRGTLLIQKIGQSTAAARLIEGENVLSASSTYTVKQRFREYRVVSQNNLPELDESLQAASSGVAYDNEIERPRILIVNAEQASTSDLCRERAKWEAAHRKGESVSVSVKTQGWRLSDGSLYEPNRLYRIESPWIGIEDELLLESMDLTISNSGTIAELSFTRKDAYLPDSSYKREDVDLLVKLVRDNQTKGSATTRDFFNTNVRPVLEE